MSHPLAGLEPEPLWRHFAALCAIPHGSKNEAAISQHVFEFGRSLGLPSRQDAVGNVLIAKPGAGDAASRPGVVLQSHLDMVNEKNRGTHHDFSKDPIRLVLDGENVKADGTTLGADNGIGCAAMLCVLEAKNLAHPPLECLFTIDEETGLTGANNLEPDMLTARCMLNLDTEEEGAIYIGCAGGIDTLGRIHIDRAAVPAGARAFRISVTGLRGGHSGCDIHEGRVNAIKVLARLLSEATHRHGVAVSSLEGGSKRNAIPREAFAQIWVPSGAEAAFSDFLSVIEAEVRTEAGRFDAPVSIAVEELDQLPSDVIDAHHAQRIIGFLHAVPHGVLQMSPDIAGLVQTSTNLATVETGPDEVVVCTSQRSSAESAKHDAARMVAAAFELAGFRPSHSDGYPGWQPNVASPILALAKQVHLELFGHEPEVKAVHAGLECGIIGEKFPGMDTVSFGPTIKNAHSPDELVHIPSVVNFWRYLTVLLTRV